MSAKAPKKDGKGYQYPAIGHVVGLDGKVQGERKRLRYMAGYQKPEKDCLNKKINRKESCQRLLDSNNNAGLIDNLLIFQFSYIIINMRKNRFP